MSLAIVIPFYKVKFFKECLQSLNDQTNKNFKVYVGNDNSPEDPKELIKDFSNSLDIEYYHFKRNIGSKSLVAQWKRCLKHLKDETWLLIMGDDDVLGSDCVERFYSSLPYIESENINVVRFSTVVINKVGQEISKRFFHPQLENSVDFLFRKSRGETRSSLSEYIFRLSKVKSIQFKNFPLGWHADDLAILEFSTFNNIYSINNASVYFRNSGENITSQSHNLVEKNSASFLFYFYLLDKKSQFFNDKQTEFLIGKFKICYENDKKDIAAFLKFTKVMVRHGKLLDYFDFVKTNLLKSFQ